MSKDSKEYPPNSMKSKDEKPKPESEKVIPKIADGTLVENKRGISRLFKDIFSGENFAGVVAYILQGVITPAIKNMVYDSATKGLERAMWGEDTSRSPSTNTGIVNYSAISTAGRYTGAQPYRGRHSPVRGNNPTGVYKLQSRVEAEEVLFNLRALIDQYGHASVADYYEMVGKTGSYTDNKWGWTTLTHARIERAHGGGYVVDLPKATPID